jgi:hypothetical protein
MVTGNQYRYLWTQIGSLGYRKKEPVNIPAEAAGIINEIISAFCSGGDHSVRNDLTGLAIATLIA